MRLVAARVARDALAMSTAPVLRAPLWALERPGDALRHIGPNWFACVMGTGIVANATALLPVRIPGLHAVGLVMWLAAALLLAALVAATAGHWLRFPDQARRHLADPFMAPFYGAPPMALLTVGAGTLLVGDDLIGPAAAVRVDAVLWSLGTIGGLVCAVAVPVVMFTRHQLRPEGTLGSWLMPVVPPMVSAATGAALIAHVPAGQARLTLLVACWAMFGLSLLASLVLIALLWGRLAYHGVGERRLVPTLWIVLGPLGQSITAANLLGAAAAVAVPGPIAAATGAAGLAYGIPVWGFAMAWLAIAATITLRGGLPFSLTWWSFTFPVGTCVTGTSLLASASGADALRVAAVGLFALLLAGWLAAGVNTARGVLSGELLRPPAR